MLANRYIIGPEMTGPEFRDALKELRLSNREAAARFGVHETTISRWATGKLPVPPSLAERIKGLREPDRPSPVTELRALIEATIALTEAIVSLTEAIKTGGPQ